MNSEDAAQGTALRFRQPTVDDGRAMHDLVVASPPLDRNSVYLYLLLGHHFADTCIVAEMDGKLVGFISGYLPPKAPDVLFIWQVAVAAEARGRGLGKSMLRELLARDACAGVQALETTITPSNQASFGLFKAMARECGAETRTETLFTEEQLGSGHEEEVLVRIAPLHRTFQGDAHG